MFQKLELKSHKSRRKIREGNSFAQLGHIVKAMECFREATCFDPSNGVAFYNLAVGFILLKDEKQARKYLTKALELTPRLYREVNRKSQLKQLINNC